MPGWCSLKFTKTGDIHPFIFSTSTKPGQTPLANRGMYALCYTQASPEKSVRTKQDTCWDAQGLVRADRGWVWLRRQEVTPPLGGGLWATKVGWRGLATGVGDLSIVFWYLFPTMCLREVVNIASKSLFTEVKLWGWKQAPCFCFLVESKASGKLYFRRWGWEAQMVSNTLVSKEKRSLDNNMN